MMEKPDKLLHRDFVVHDKLHVGILRAAGQISLSTVNCPESLSALGNVPLSVTIY